MPLQINNGHDELANRLRPVLLAKFEHKTFTHQALYQIIFEAIDDGQTWLANYINNDQDITDYRVRKITKHCQTQIIKYLLPYEIAVFQTDILKYHKLVNQLSNRIREQLRQLLCKVDEQDPQIRYAFIAMEAIIFKNLSQDPAYTVDAYMIDDQIRQAIDHFWLKFKTLITKTTK